MKRQESGNFGCIFNTTYYVDDIMSTQYVVFFVDF